MSTPVVLVVGFEPFDGELVNPAQEIARRLDGEWIDGHLLVGAALPVEFTRAPQQLADLLDRHRPRLVFALGQAGGRSEIAFERVAVNLIDARIADNAGVQPIDARVLENGANALFTSLPVKAMNERLRSLGIPCTLSLSAGTFVCNQVFYWLCHLLANGHTQGRGGFIHVPWLPEQAERHPGEASLPLELMVHGIRAAIECALQTERDAPIAGGATF